MWFFSVALAGPPIAEAFPPPEGAIRVEADAWGTWLQARPLADGDGPVKTWDGRVVGHPARVVELSLIGGHLQECADSLIRLRAEWRKERNEPVMFHATSGDPMPWERWQKGERPYEHGRGLAWKPGTKGGWEAYLSRVYNWAGTISLKAYDTEPATDAPRPGDLLVDPGSPGHTVVLLDVAKRGSETFVLVGEGFMPAQDFHVEIGPHQGWWAWEPGVMLPHWPLPGETHRRFIR